MLESIRRFKLVNISFAASALLVVGGWLWAYVSLHGIEQPLIIHFVRGQINQIGGTGDLAAMGVFGTAAVALNFFLASEFEKRDRWWGKFLAAGTLFIALLIFIAFAVIISVN